MVYAELWNCVLVLGIGSVVLFLLGIYFFEVIPQGIGVPQHPLFFLRCFRNCGRRSVRTGPVRKESISMESAFGSDDAAKESDFAEGIREEEVGDYAVVVKGIEKNYVNEDGNVYTALNKIYFHVEHNEVFGILGPNKSGKSALMSILTGIHSPTAGKAWINGYSLNDELHKIQAISSVCPQVDNLWPDLTVVEHLQFYARLKGIPPESEEHATSQAMKEVRLGRFADVKAKLLTAGLKRRLSVAISLVGDPVLIFLDEPSGSLDANERSQLWDILAQFKGHRTVVLTTNSLEEADAVCERIGILHQGEVKFIGNQVHLKNKFKGGYQVYANCYTKRELFPLEGETQVSKEVLQFAKGRSVSSIYKDVVKFMEEVFPSCKLTKAFEGTFTFDVLYS